MEKPAKRRAAQPVAAPSAAAAAAAVQNWPSQARALKAAPQQSHAHAHAPSAVAGGGANVASLGGSVGNGRYAIRHKIGSGSFGEIFLGTDTRTGAKVAIKLESLQSKYPQLEYESRVYQSIKHGPGLAQVHWYGTHGHCNVMVMDLLGDTLESMYNRCKRRFSLKTVTMLAVQLLDRLQHHHENNYLHRDIKPDNFLMGIEPNEHTVYIIDMGLCKRYRDPKTREHIPYKENKKMIGTPRYASINAHIGIEQSRRDDLESLGYLLVYFMAGELPWQGLQAKTKQEKYDKISKKKSDTPPEVLCHGMPAEFGRYLTYCRNLRFEDEPDYDYLRGLFYGLFRSSGFTDDFVYDWTRADRAPVGLRFLATQRTSPATAAAALQKQHTVAPDSAAAAAAAAGGASAAAAPGSVAAMTSSALGAATGAVSHSAPIGAPVVSVPAHLMAIAAASATAAAAASAAAGATSSAPVTGQASGPSSAAAAAMAAGFTSVPISHIGAASIPGAVLDKDSARIFLPPGYTFVPAYEVVLPPGASFDEAAGAIRYEGRSYPMMQQHSASAHMLQLQQHLQRGGAPVGAAAAAGAPAAAAAALAAAVAGGAPAQRAVSPALTTGAGGGAGAGNASAAQQQVQAIQAPIQAPIQPPIQAPIQPPPQRAPSTSNLSVLIPASGSPGGVAGAAAMVDVPPSNRAPPTAVTALTAASGTSGTGGVQPMAVVGQTPVAAASLLDIAAAQRPGPRKPGDQPVPMQHNAGLSPPRLPAVNASASAATAASTGAVCSLADAQAMMARANDAHKKELEQWVDAYEQIEADRDKWRKKCDEIERSAAGKTARLDEYEKLVVRLKQELSKLREHHHSCPATAVTPNSRKRKHAAVTSAPTNAAADLLLKAMLPPQPAAPVAARVR